MSIQCPQCAATVEQDFGMVQCQGCQALLVVDIDGNVQLSGSVTDELVQFKPEAQELPAEDLNLIQVPPQPDYIDSPVEPGTPPENLELPANSMDLPSPADQETSESNDQISQSEQIEQQEAPPQNAIISEAPMLDEQPRFSEEQTAEGSLAEVVEFGNSQSSDLPLSYTLVLEGIDHKDVREQLAQVLADPKFNWNVAEIMSKVENGRLELKKLNPVVTSVLVLRLEHLPIKIGWRQHAFET